MGGPADALAEEVNATFTHLLKQELFSPTRSPSARASPAQPQASPSRHAQLRRPMIFQNPTLSSFAAAHTPVSNAGTTPLHHHPPPAMAGSSERGKRELSPASVLPPLPLHAPSTPTSGGARAPGAGPSSSHHRAHQTQVALNSGTRTGNSPPSSRRTHLSPPPGSAQGSPSTPTKKRLLNFTSPAATRMGQLSREDSLDNMAHERYSLSPVGKDTQKVLLSPRKGVRQIARTPFKVLDAPELQVRWNELRGSTLMMQDDFYLNLVSWSTSNVLGVGLNQCVYLWSATTSQVTKLCDMTTAFDGGEEQPDTITGLEWTNRVSG